MNVVLNYNINMMMTPKRKNTKSEVEPKDNFSLPLQKTLFLKEKFQKHKEKSRQQTQYVNITNNINMNVNYNVEQKASKKRAQGKQSSFVLPKKITPQETMIILHKFNNSESKEKKANLCGLMSNLNKTTSERFY